MRPEPENGLTLKALHADGPRHSNEGFYVYLLLVFLESKLRGVIAVDIIGYHTSHHTRRIIMSHCTSEKSGCMPPPYFVSLVVSPRKPGADSWGSLAIQGDEQAAVISGEGSRVGSRRAAAAAAANPFLARPQSAAELSRQVRATECSPFLLLLWQYRRGQCVAAS
jgi:hypothetical protein